VIYGPVRNFPDTGLECVFDTIGRVGTWHDPDLGRPIAAPLERCAQLLGVELATVRTLAAQVEPYLRADGTRIWSLMQLERQLRPAAYRRRRGGYLDRRHAPTTDAPVRATVGSIHGQVTASLDLPLGSGIALPTSSEEGGAMAHPNEELVRRGYAAFNTADVETLRQLFADTTVFHEPGRSPISGDYEGIDQVLGFFGTLAEQSGGTFQATLHDVVANDDHAVGLHSSDAERDGRAVRSPTVLVFHVRDGRITETWSHHHDQHDFDAFWA
jgi:ketosteroid isomerase-like protein